MKPSAWILSIINCLLPLSVPTSLIAICLLGAWCVLFNTNFEKFLVKRRWTAWENLLGVRSWAVLAAPGKGCVAAGQAEGWSQAKELQINHSWFSGTVQGSKNWMSCEFQGVPQSTTHSQLPAQKVIRLWCYIFSKTFYFILLFLLAIQCIVICWIIISLDFEMLAVLGKT